MLGVFADWQGRYADAGIATFPVREKRPAVKGYLKIGLGASKQFAIKFPDADQFGFACQPNRITVLDVDTPDERVLWDALSEFGATPIIVRTGSGNWQAWYRHGGERRRVRPDPSRPIDILGHGFVVAPPSKGSKRPYELVSGSLDDLRALPTMRRVEAAPAAATALPANDVALVETGRRNEALWRACMVQARSCHTINQLMEAAVQINQTSFYEPLPDIEVMRVVASAWSKQISGDNWMGTGRIVPTTFADIDELMQESPDAFILKQKLRREHEGLRDSFVIANAMSAIMPNGGWCRARFARARQRLEERGEIELVTPASRYTGPPVYRFKGARK